MERRDRNDRENGSVAPFTEVANRDPARRRERPVPILARRSRRSRPRRLHKGDYVTSGQTHQQAKNQRSQRQHHA